MSIRRDYSRNFFHKRRRSWGRIWFILAFFALIIGFLLYVSANYSRLQLAALDQIGLAPTATPFASNYAVWGVEALAAGDIDEARAMFEQAVAQRPNNVDYLTEYGNLLIEAGDVELAQTIGQQAIDAAPDDPRGYAVLGRALMYSEPAQAIQVTIRGQEADENYPPLLAVQGVAYTQLGRFQEGLRQTLRSIELAPDDPFVLRAAFTPMVYVGRYQDAADYLTQAISLNPNITAPYFELAALYNIQQPAIYQPELTVALYNRILEIDPESARANLRLCQTYATVQDADFALAEPFCQRALQIDPTDGEIYMTLGRMQYNRRNYEGSIESFETCQQLSGDEHIECFYLRGLAHYWLAECDASWDLLTEAQQMAVDRNAGAGVTNTIEIGLFNITERCPGYQDFTPPTPLPPTEIPPTPIGGFS